MLDEKIITSDLLRKYSKDLNMDYYTVIRYLINNKYLYRILKGIFYKPTIEERKLNKIDISHKEALVEALRIKGVKNWYFGLETALKLNNLTHEYFTTDFVINDTIFRAKPINILGHKIKFIKLKKNLFNFGIKDNISNLEKTVLDIIYLSKYDGLNNTEIKNKIASLLKYCSKSRFLKYSKEYNESIVKFIREII